MMEKEQFARTKTLIGQEALDKLKSAKVLLIGVGGVGSYVCEALARVGVGLIDLIDKDVVDATNINRQLIALHSTVGKPKVEVAAQRLKDINPDIKIKAMECFYLPQNSEQFDFAVYDYVIDAVDNVTAKLDIIEKAKVSGVPVISSMGTGNKMDPTAFKIADIEDTKVCPLAKVIRKELRKREITEVKVVYSEEEPLEVGQRIPASISFVPAAAGLLIAKAVVDDLVKK